MSLKPGYKSSSFPQLLLYTDDIALIDALLSSVWGVWDKNKGVSAPSISRMLELLAQTTAYRRRTQYILVLWGMDKIYQQKVK